MNYHLVVIGAGIQGAGVAQAAAAAGYSVLVLEQTAAAAGTSSKSSKLIHGGLRYLETAQFGLVRESLQERALLLKLAPSLVHLSYLHIPIYESSTRSRLTIRAGLSLYSLLAGMDKNSRFCKLAKSEWQNLTGLKKEKLKGVFRYQEAQTDDAELTRAVLRSAQSLGVEMKMPAKFISAEIQGEKTQVIYEQNGQQVNIQCDVLINAAGPWAAQVNQKISPHIAMPHVDLIQGSHLLLPPLLQQHFYLESPRDKRAIFVLPWKGKLMVGTTEKLHQDEPEKSQITTEEKNYLLETLLHYFPHLAIPEEVDSFSGLRVLPKSDKNAFSRPRDVILIADQEHKPKVITLMGGKLTTYRATAERVVEMAKRALPPVRAVADTKLLILE
jgi:glycerol-3-phosphate dehydrogenase